MDAFIQQHQKDVIGVLHGFDRMRFRGTLRAISYGSGVDRFLGTVGVRYKQYKEFVLDLSERMVAHAQQVAQEAGRPFEYLANRNEDKQAHAQAIATRDGITAGLVCAQPGIVPELSDLPGRPGGLWLSAWATAMPISVLLLPGPGVRVDAHTGVQLVAVWDSGLSQWSGVPGAADEPSGNRL